MKIKNRSNSVVVYRIPDLNVRRRFAPGEIKDVPSEELEKLLYQPGGKRLLVNFLQLKEQDVKQLDIEEQEKEYYYTEDQIKNIILNGTLNEFLDMLDFAPEGVINLVKSYALSLPMTDLYKIKGLKDKTGFDAAKAMEITADQEEVKETARKRRVEDSKTTTINTTNKYKVIADN